MLNSFSITFGCCCLRIVLLFVVSIGFCFSAQKIFPQWQKIFRDYFDENNQYMARLAQSVERKALNLVVVGSSPTVGDHF